MKSILVIDKPDNCGDCPLCIYTAEEKRYIGYCNTSNEDYYCKALYRFMEYDKVDGGIDILTKPEDCPLRDLPQKQVVNEYNFENYANGVNIGWNRCLAEITGEKYIPPEYKEKC